MPLDLCAVSKTRDRLSTTLQDLRRRLAGEYKRIKHRRTVCMRHYVTTLAIPKPDDGQWMYVWLSGGTDYFLAFTSLTRLFNQFEPHYPMTSYNAKGGRPRRLRHHHQVLGVMMALYDDCLD
ncbi:hypothetical protein PHMEG_00014714 [Phytophthora megakarya]|uniref:Uncharacterized protein n=1 Tax=Phytophthora megakarya TaxID=4795 RepID=A0A225W449_9STRA|nr:hypothetical protein PHMEG_00014714 [Phytophthora megakarya]